MLKDLKFGNDGNWGISMCDMPKLLICGIEKPSKFNKPVRGDWRASLGFSSDEELEPSEEDDEEEEDDDDDDGDDDVDGVESDVIEGDDGG